MSIQIFSIKSTLAEVFKEVARQKCYSNSKEFVRRKKIFTSRHFWALDYHVSTVGIVEEAIRNYIKEDEEERRIDQLNLFDK